MRCGAASPFAERAKSGGQLRSRTRTESLVERALVIGKENVGPVVRGTTGVRDCRSDRAAVIRIGHPAHEAIGLEPVDELRDVGPPATVPLSELRERERLGGQHEVPERSELGEREARRGERPLGARFDGSRRVEEEEGEGAPARGIAVGHE